MIKVSRILHAGYVFESGETTIAFDPIFENPFSRNCHAFPSVQFDHAKITALKLSAVFISHYHDDHCSFDSLNLLDRATPIYAYCHHDELFVLLRELGFTFVQALQIDQHVAVGSFKITPRRAFDADVDCLFQIEAAELRILNVVDSMMDDESLANLSHDKPWDLVLWPFQAMRELAVLSPSRAESVNNEIPAEWLEQLKALSPRIIIPSSCQFVQESWSWYNHALFPISYQQFTAEVRKALPTTTVIRMDPSVTFCLSKDGFEKSVPLPWITPIGDQEVDYSFKPERKTPTTGEIAKNFAALSVGETQRVLQYIRSELQVAFTELDVAADSYFAKPRLWKLSLYDHDGACQEFHFRAHSNKLVALERAEGPLAWTTELPIAKLYAALENGEALTSMYVRINDQVFVPTVEAELKEVELMEDPLVRALFTGVFGAYQKAQLRKIKETKKSSHQSQSDT